MERSLNIRKVFERCKRPAVRRPLTLIALFLLTISLGADQEATVRGEIVDSYCYVGRGIRGPSHRECAVRCARKGIALVLIEDTTRRVYTLMPPRDEMEMPERVLAAAGTTRTITGRMFVKSGSRFLTVDAMK